MGIIILENIKIYANHGCLDEEERIGSDYLIDLEVEGDFTKASETDELVDALDYVQLNQIVKEEVGQRSKLLEHVVHRILDRIGRELTTAKRAKVKLSKLNPPIGGHVEKVSVVMEKKYE